MMKTICCNCCGKTLLQTGQFLAEDAVSIRKEWGYFSAKDLEIHEMIICEACYDAWVQTFRIPVSVAEKQEVIC